MIIEVKTADGWVARQPETGEVYRITYPTSHKIILTKEKVQVTPSLTPTNLIPINFTAVDGAVSTSADFAKITGKVGGTLTIHGTLAIPDQTFITPIEKVNIATNEVTTEYITTEVVNQAFSIALTLPGGKYRVTQELMNAELPQPMFELPTIEIYITI
ncbi:hypothetical protein ACPV4A_02220 [Vibrio rotiferianus]|uniref:hypothetical protein n=1 Tax=Vibrio rotiferianus TaxID=190895 RepID=UPI00406A9F6A